MTTREQVMALAVRLERTADVLAMAKWPEPTGMPNVEAAMREAAEELTALLTRNEALEKALQEMPCACQRVLRRSGWEAAGEFRSETVQCARCAALAEPAREICD